MSSLFGSVSIALRSMLAQQAAISVTTNNVSNINTPGYSRQRVDLIEADAVFNGQQMVGTGVDLQGITSLRDRVLELRINDEKRQQGSLQGQVRALQDIETMFSSDTNTLGDDINQFFNSISELSADASSVPLRQAVLTAGGNLATRFQLTATTLKQRESSIDLEVQQSVQHVNEITGEIAKLNLRIAESSTTGSEASSFEDRRNLLLQDLSTEIGNKVTVADDGFTVTAANGSTLVLGHQAVPLTVSRSQDGSPCIMSEGQDITSAISGGQLQGLLNVRDKVIPDMLANLDTLAGSISTSVNGIHRAGFDLDGNAGGDFFAPPPGGNLGAASTIALAISDPRKLAASTNATAGDNANLNQLLDLRQQPAVNGQRITEYYAKIAFDLGSKLSNAKSELDASDLISQQLANQRGGLSGVSLDEEAANLVRYQRAYEAAARVLSVLSDLTEISVNLGK
jgi:flagellar hook-associated protein 1